MSSGLFTVGSHGGAVVPSHMEAKEPPELTEEEFNRPAIIRQEEGGEEEGLRKFTVGAIIQLLHRLMSFSAARTKVPSRA